MFKTVAIPLASLLVTFTGHIAAKIQEGDAYPFVRPETPFIESNEESIAHAEEVSSVSSSSSIRSSSTTSSDSSSSVQSSSPSSVDDQLLGSTGSKSIIIFLREQRAYLLEDDNVVKTYQISSGAWETPTPRGEFKIYRKQKLRISSQDVPYRMPYYMAFTPSESMGIHALPYLGYSPESSAYWHEAVSHIGIPVSHGCIRLLPEEAIEVYNWVDVGTPVSIRA